MDESKFFVVLFLKKGVDFCCCCMLYFFLCLALIEDSPMPAGNSSARPKTRSQKEAAKAVNKALTSYLKTGKIDTKKYWANVSKGFTEPKIQQMKREAGRKTKP